MSELSRLRWRCRRGTREMDILFERFLLYAYPQLTSDEQAVFERFLDEPDPEILDWITGKTEPGIPEYREIIRKMQEKPPPGI
jgi:antitoxin CptB